MGLTLQILDQLIVQYVREGLATIPDLPLVRHVLLENIGMKLTIIMVSLLGTKLDIVDLFAWNADVGLITTNLDLPIVNRVQKELTQILQDYLHVSFAQVELSTRRKRLMK